MTDRFGATSTTHDVLEGVDLRGRRVLITGACAPLGTEIAHALAGRGAEVVGLAHFADAEPTWRPTDLYSQTASLLPMDLGSLASVSAGVQVFQRQRWMFDLVVAAEEVKASTLQLTADGFERHFGVNHLGHHALAEKMASLMNPGARLIVHTSGAHRLSDLDLNDPNCERTAVDAAIAYARSKTANVLFAVEFDRRYRSRGIRAVAVNPDGDRDGAIFTSMEANPGRAAATTVWSGVVASAAEIGGRYCESCQVTGISERGDAGTGVRGYAVDPSRARALWTVSETLLRYWL